MNVAVSLAATTSVNGGVVMATVGPWNPIFKGIELASGQQQEEIASETLQQVLCFRVDLTDPDVVLLTTPKCTNCGAYETTAENTSYFLEKNGTQIAINGGFYASHSGPSDTPLGTPDDVYGLAISRGVVVSPADNTTYDNAFLFTTNNQAIFVPTNSPPGTNTAGIYTAITGNHVLLLNGVNLKAATPTDLDPRTALGLSSDRRYLFVMTIDGRQPGWSEGADFHDTGEWLRRFGASDGINLDGGGSTTSVMADCAGHPVRLNRSSFVAGYGRERNIGHNFGVYAPALPGQLENLVVEPATTTALITWRTPYPATTQVEYGRTINYGSATPLDSRLVTNHVATISGLAQGSNYFFRAVSTAGERQSVQGCQFTTLATTMVTTQLFGFTQIWAYNTNNLDGTAWKTTNYDDNGWIGRGRALLYVENSTRVGPKGTAMAPYVAGQAIPRTYYFRTHFNFSGSTSGNTLVLSNYIDEGDAATSCPDVLYVGGTLLQTNLLEGDNVLAVETHNYTGSDIVFGTALLLRRPSATAVTNLHLNIRMDNNVATLFWNGEGLTLQQIPAFGSGPGWSDVPGTAASRSPVIITNTQTMFYRLRN